MANTIKFMTGFQSYSLSEATQRPGVLGTVKGTFFLSRVPSRNDRVYEDEAWKQALNREQVKYLLENRLMFGTVGHDDVDADSLIRDLKVSHVTTILRHDENTGLGYGEADILDTPVGRVLYTIIKSGSKMATSSKATGGYKSKTSEGVNVVDPDTFNVHRFDFVVDPGFLQAQPQLRESLDSAYKATPQASTKPEDLSENKEDSIMKELLEMLTKEKVALTGEVDSLLKKNETLTAANGALTQSLKEAEDLKAKIADLEKQLADAKEELKKNGEESDKGEKEAEEALKPYKALGTPAEINTKLESLKEYTALGLVKDIKESFAQFKMVGERLKKIGTIPMIEKALLMAKTYAENHKTQEMKEAADKFSATYGVPIEQVTEMLKKDKKENVEKTLKSLKEAADLKIVKETKPPKKEEEKVVESRTKRLFNQMK